MTPTPTVPTPQGDTPAAGESVLVPKRMALTHGALLDLNFICGTADETIQKDDVVGELWIGEITDDDGSKRYGLNACNSEYQEEGSVQVVALAPAPVASPVRTDGDGVRDRLVKAILRNTADLEGQLSFSVNLVPDVLAALPPEGETGPAVADAKLIDELLWRAAYHRRAAHGTFEASERRTAELFEAAVAALTVSPSPSERDQHQGETQNEAIAMLREAIAKIDAFDNEPGDRATVILERKDQSTFEMIGVDNKPLRLSDLRKIAALSPEPHPVADKREGGDR